VGLTSAVLSPLSAAASTSATARIIPLAAAAALTEVDMELLVVAAQVEPRAGSQPIGDDASTKRVQDALRSKGYSIGSDGWFGNETTATYAKWQGRLGYTGLDATGIPGPTSLTKLGAGRFTVIRKIDVGAKIGYSGVTVNTRTKAMLTKADSTLSWSIDLSQGSYHPGTNASGGTHDGGGAVDISVGSLSTQQRWATVKALRSVGFAAWLRSPAEADWPWHIHAVAIGDTDMSIQARNQIADYYLGKNGLANHHADTTPTASRVAFTWWEKTKR
jgi:hypothetical protein